MRNRRTITFLAAALLATYTLGWSGSASAQASPGAPPASSEPTRYPILSGVVPRPYAFSLALLGAGGFWLQDSVLAREKISSPIGIPMSLRVSFLYFLFVEGGFGVVQASDDGSFRERACPVFGGDCQDLESTVSGSTEWARGGVLFRAFVPLDDNALQLAFFGGIGRRGMHLTRKIPKCEDCSSLDLNVDGGTYVSPELDVSWASNEHGKSRLGGAFGIKCEYEHYLNGDIRSALWVSAFLEVL
jgi:hypothetical protein